MENAGGRQTNLRPRHAFSYRYVFMSFHIIMPAGVGLEVATMKSPSSLPSFNQATSGIFAKHIYRQENASNHKMK
jgi:hypothetical protein